MKIRLDKIYDSFNSQDELVQDLQKENICEFEIPFNYLGHAKSNIDLMHDYLEVSFVAEHIIKHAELISSRIADRDKYYFSFIIKFKPKNHNQLSSFIYKNAKKYSHKEEPTSDEIMDFIEELQEYEDKLEDFEFTFPDLIDDYYANLVNAGYFQIASENVDDENEYLENEYKKYPERRFYYWKSAASKKLSSEIYISSEAWIIPSKYSLQKILSFYFGTTKAINLEEANKYKYNGKEIILNNTSAIKYNIKKQLNSARNCAYSTLGRFIELSHRHETSFLLSEFGDILVVKDTFFYYVFYLDNVKLSFNELIEIRTNLGPIYEQIENIISISDSIDLDWSEFDEDKFELLCYDILYYHPKFDNRTIRKMGKAKSRDGGRDITIRTKELPGKESDLYIFQCKYFKSNSSLSASKIGSASNVIMQYGAKGYGVFTTGVIDSTLYDMLDGFATNYNISTRENWSIYEIERYLSLNKAIKKRYF